VSGDGGIALLQATGTIQGSVTTVSLDFLSPVTAHNAIVVALNYDSMSTPQVTDTLKSNFKPAVSQVQTAGGPVPGLDSIWYALDVGAGADQVTVTISSASQNYFEVFIHEYSGVAALDAIAAQTQAIGTTAMQTGFATTTKAGDLIFALGVDGTVAPGNGFTMETYVSGDITEDQIAGAPGKYQATATASANSWCLTMAAFRTF
jgi:hypothetical protein